MTRVALDTDLVSLADLISDIEAGRLALADFQRDFDWSERDARAFLATAIMGWPAGALLMFRGETSDVRSRPFVEGPPTAPRPPRVVLDGQQRLTAAYHALGDRGRFVHAIALSVLSSEDVEELEGGMRTFARERWDARFRADPWLNDELYVPAYALRDSESFFRFRDLAVETANMDGAATDRALQLAWRDRLSAVRDYTFPIVLIAPVARNEIDDASIARIFERVNRTGQRLGAFDLSVARSYGATNLRDLWDDARLLDPMLDRWLGPSGLSEDGMPLLRAMALRGDPPDVRQSAVLALDGPEITNAWPGFVRATKQALAFFRDRCGVLEPDWLPYRAMLVTLIGLAVDEALEPHTELLEQWFWSRAFALRFEAAANTRTVSEYLALRDGLRSGEISVEPIRKDVLRRATKRRFAAVFRATQCLLATRAPSDPFVGPLDVGEPHDAATGLRSDVVFSSILTRDAAADDDLHLRAAAMAFLWRNTARSVRNDELSVFASGWAPFDQSQLLPAIVPNEPSVLVERRAQAIAEEVARITGQEIVDTDDEA